MFGGVSGRFGAERTIEGILKAARGVEFRVDAGAGGGRGVDTNAGVEEIAEVFREKDVGIVSYRYGERETASAGSDTSLSREVRRWQVT